MSSAWLADLGAGAWTVLWLPVVAWTVLAASVELALRLGRASARVGLGVRGALLAALPGLIAVPPVLARWVPSVRPVQPALPAGTADVQAPSLPIGTPDATMAVPAPPSVDVALGLATLTAGVVSVFAVGVLIGGLVWLHRYRRSLCRAPNPVRAEALALAARLGIRQPLDVVLAEPASAPFTVGWRRPVVAVPADLRREHLPLALAHELAHVREAHYGWSLAEQVVRALFVWHPLVHGLGRGLALDRERAVDATVVRLWPERARAYGHLLLSIASRPSPALALGASSSTLIHRLDAMTRLRPDRRRLARLAAAAVLALPLLLAAAAVPDARPAAAQSPTASAPAARSSAAEPGHPTDPDSLMQHVEQRSVWLSDAERRVEVRLKPGTSRATALAIADYLSDGDLPGTLVVTAGGQRIERSTLRPDAIPPPPPPPAAAPPAAPEPPAPAPPPVPPTPAAAPVPPLAPSAEGMADDELDRLVTMLHGELLSVTSEINALRPRMSDAAAEAEYIRLDARRDLVLQRYRFLVSLQERRRLDRLAEDARSGQ